MGVAKLTDQNTIVPAASKYARVERERRYLLQDLPEGLTRAMTASVTPVLRLDMLLANSEVPPLCAPLTACDVSTGTSVPTLMLAGMLSVAMMLGAEITFVRCSFS